MKRIFATVSFVLGVMIMAHSQSIAPVVDAREHNQQARINEGVATGQVTRTEAKRLRAEQRRVRKTERRANADGRVTPREQNHLRKEQNRASRDIRRQKHDPQQRP